MTKATTKAPRKQSKTTSTVAVRVSNEIAAQLAAIVKTKKDYTIAEFIREAINEKLAGKVDIPNVGSVGISQEAQAILISQTVIELVKSQVAEAVKAGLDDVKKAHMDEASKLAISISNLTKSKEASDQLDFRIRETFRKTGEMVTAVADVTTAIETLNSTVEGLN